MSEQPANILLVEDNPADVRWMQECFRDALLDNHVTVAADGERALDILRREGAHSDAPHPDLILLDLNLPKVSGYEVLNALHDDPELAKIPLLVITSSANELELMKRHNLAPECYIVKPLTIETLVKALGCFDAFRLRIVKKE